MAPNKVLANASNKLLGKPSVVTRSKNSISISGLTKNMADLAKRKADNLSPPKGKNTKRCAFRDLTNNAVNKATDNAKKVATNPTALLKKPTVTTQASKINKVKEVVKITTIAQPKNAVLVNLKPKLASVKNTENIPPAANVKVAATKDKIHSPPKVKDVTKYDSIQKVTLSGVRLKTSFRRSLELPAEKSDDSSLYSSALENVSASLDDSLVILTPVKKAESYPTEGPPAGVVDFDKENIDDPIQLSHYAMDIFTYLKSREEIFKVEDYMSRQVVITKWMRSLLVDWMVEVQENFELNHETLYLGVKLTDMYLNKIVVGKEILQLVGAAALFLASKYDERMPPLIDDFLYICENAFSREDFIKMEMDVVKVIGFDLGIPLSYRFLRRYARCCKANMPTLTLARYISELALMEYPFIFESESKCACAALYIALKMKKISDWTPTLEYYSGYKLEDFRHIVLEFNKMLHKPHKQLKTVRNKYSHKIFFEVAAIPLVEESEL